LVLRRELRPAPAYIGVNVTRRDGGYRVCGVTEKGSADGAITYSERYWTEVGVTRDALKALMQITVTDVQTTHAQRRLAEIATKQQYLYESDRQKEGEINSFVVRVVKEGDFEVQVVMSKGGQFTQTITRRYANTHGISVEIMNML